MTSKHGKHGDGPQPRPDAKKVTLVYMRDAVRPEDLLDFIELRPFTRRWEKLGLDDENDLAILQLAIMADPKSGLVIEGTHGLRKLRYAPARWNCGKSGAARVLYVYFEEFGIILLCLVYGKNEVDAISAAAKKSINGLIFETERELKRLKSIRIAKR